MRSGEGVTSFNKDNSAKLSDEKSAGKLSGMSICFENTRKKSRPLSLSRLRMLKSLFSLKPVRERRWLSRFPTKMTLIHARALLIIEKISFA